MNVSIPTTSATSGFISEPRRYNCTCVSLYSVTAAHQVHVLSNVACRVTSRVCYQPTRFWGLCFLANGCPRLRLGSAKQLVAVPHRHRTRMHVSQVSTGFPPLMHARLHETPSTAGMHQPCRYGVKARRFTCMRMCMSPCQIMSTRCVLYVIGRSLCSSCDRLGRSHKLKSEFLATPNRL